VGGGILSNSSARVSERGWIDIRRGRACVRGRTEPGAHAASRAVTRHATRALERGAVLRARSACEALGRAMVERASIAAILVGWWGGGGGAAMGQGGEGVSEQCATSHTDRKRGRRGVLHSPGGGSEPNRREISQHQDR
jgi:hypothetical protein